jgi:NAD(P)-dependent dehydrogenase (short-subunit alcohol dehydrogenase family)
MRPWALITPASKGIGLALTRRVLLTTRLPVVATARKDVDQTKEHILSEVKDVDESRLTVLPLDVTGIARMRTKSASNSLTRRS